MYPEEYGLSLVTAPTREPVTLDEAKCWLKLQHSADDDRIRWLIESARESIEEALDLQMVTATRKLTFYAFPSWEIYLPRSPASSITSITYIDTAGTEQTLDSSLYTLDSTVNPAVLTPAYSQTWPTTRDQRAAVNITYVCGYGAPSSVPQALRNALLVHVAWSYRHPGDDGAAAPPMPDAVWRLAEKHWSGCR